MVCKNCGCRVRKRTAMVRPFDEDEVSKWYARRGEGQESPRVTCEDAVSHRRDVFDVQLERWPFGVGADDAVAAMRITGSRIFFVAFVGN
jgi:hypothetical protein